MHDLQVAHIQKSGQKVEKRSRPLRMIFKWGVYYRLGKSRVDLPLDIYYQKTLLHGITITKTWPSPSFYPIFTAFFTIECLKISASATKSLKANFQAFALQKLHL